MADGLHGMTRIKVTTLMLTLLCAPLPSFAQSVSTDLSQAQQLIKSILSSQSHDPILPAPNISANQISPKLAQLSVDLMLQAANELLQTIPNAPLLYTPEWGAPENMMGALRLLSPSLLSALKHITEHYQSDIHYSTKPVADWDRATTVQNLLSLYQQLTALNKNPHKLTVSSIQPWVVYLQRETEDLVIALSKQLDATQISQKRQLITALYGYKPEGDGLFVLKTITRHTTITQTLPSSNTDENAPDEEASSTVAAENASQVEEAQEITQIAAEPEWLTIDNIAEDKVDQPALSTLLNQIQSQLFALAQHKNISLGHEPLQLDSDPAQNEFILYLQIISISGDLEKLKTGLGLTSASGYQVASTEQNTLYATYQSLMKTHYLLTRLQEILI